MGGDEEEVAGDVRRKLGGYLRAVVSVSSDVGVEALAPLSPCSLFACGGVSLAPIPDGGGATPRSKGRACGGGGVVRQLRALVSSRCVEVEGRVLRAVARRGREGGGGDGEVEARAVVLFDVYLPVSVWSGWQFPRSRAAAAAAVFKHVRCVHCPLLFEFGWSLLHMAALLRGGLEVGGISSIEWRIVHARLPAIRIVTCMCENCSHLSHFVPHSKSEFGIP